jgi:signal transduction histidine kinase
MFLASGGTEEYLNILTLLRMIAQPLTGLFLLKFGWGFLKEIPLPPWTIFIPGVLIVPLAYVITYATTTFITPSPVEIPIDIWSRYLLYLPGSILAGIGFMRNWRVQRDEGLTDVANLMLGAGVAFLVEAFIVGLVVPAAPYGPSSYYNYNRVIHNAFSAEAPSLSMFSGFTTWLDYQRVLEITGLPIQFWRMLSSFAVTFFVIRGLGVFEARRRMQLLSLQKERDRAQEAAFDVQVSARQTAERWTEVLFSINRKIIELDDVDEILLFIIEKARELLPSDFIGLALLSDDRSRLELKCVSTEETTQLVESPLVVHSPLILKTIKTSRSFLSPVDINPTALDKIVFFLAKPASGVGIVCLELDEHPIGALWAARSDNIPFSDTDLIWLECMADQVVIAIQNGLLTTQLQSLSITEERARIARDMHDGLAQILGYLNLQVQTLDALLKQGKQDELVIELEQMRKAVKVANADVRENILSLRTTLSNEKGLVSAMSEYLDEFGIQTGIETQFTNEVGNEMNLSSLSEVQLVCIFQEALANVRKHALTSRVSVLVTRKTQDKSEYVHLQVVDEGIGIMNHDSKHHFGLRTMTERASSVGGILEVHSEAGMGTTIECRLPCLEPGRMKKSQALFSSKRNISVP